VSRLARYGQWIIDPVSRIAPELASPIKRPPFASLNYFASALGLFFENQPLRGLLYAAASSSNPLLCNAVAAWAMASKAIPDRSAICNNE
jgi:hypothetical protein